MEIEIYMKDLDRPFKTRDKGRSGKHAWVKWNTFMLNIKQYRYFDQFENKRHVPDICINIK